MTTQRSKVSPAYAAVRPSARGLLSLLRLAGLRRLVIVKMLGALGDGAFQGALAGVVLFSPDQAADPAEIAAGFAVLLLPYSVIGPFAGALLDRWSRRQVLVWANLLRALFVAAVAVEVATAAPRPLMFVTALLVTGASRFVGSGLSASVPHTVAADTLTGANSLATTVGSVSAVAGGAVAIGLRSLIGETDGPMAVVTASVIAFYAASALVALRFAVTALGPDETDEPAQPLRAVLQGLAAGIRHVRERRHVGYAIVLVMLVRFCLGLATLLMLLLYRHHFAGSALATGMGGIAEVLAVLGLGLLLGAVTTAAIVRHVGPIRYLVLLLSISAVITLVCGLQFTQPLTLVTALTLAFSYQSAKVVADTIVQSGSDDAHVGRVFALYDTGTSVFYVAAFAIGVAIVPPDGRGVGAVVLIAAVYLGTALWFLVGMRHVAQTVWPGKVVEHHHGQLVSPPDSSR